MQGEQKARESTQLEFILSRLSDQNSRLVTTIQEFEGIGHKVKNTNYPRVDESAKKEEAPKPEGLLDEISLQLNYYEGHNYRLQELLKKLSPLL